MSTLIRTLLVSLTLIGVTTRALSEVIITYHKTPLESQLIQMDFSQVIGTNGITLVSVTATNEASGADATVIFIATTPAPTILSGTSKVVLGVRGGVAGQTYRVHVLVQDATVAANRHEGQALIYVDNT